MLRWMSSLWEAPLSSTVALPDGHWIYLLDVTANFFNCEGYSRVERPLQISPNAKVSRGSTSTL